MWSNQLEKEEYEFLEFNISAKPVPNITKQDYKQMIDLALQMKDFEWARALKNKMNKKFGGPKK